MPSLDALRVGLGATTNEQPIAVGIASGPFLGANANRIALMLAPPFANNVTISTKGTAVLGQGINLPALGGMVRVGVDDYGPGIKGALTAIASAASTITVFEVSSSATG